MGERAGLCQCGCGGTTKISLYNNRSKGWVKGEHFRYINGHTNRFKAVSRPSVRYGEVDGEAVAFVSVASGEELIVDLDCASLATAHPWCLASGYAYRNLKNGGKEYLHRVIAAAPDGFEVDHRHGNRLDLRRSQLRIATRQQNQWNIGPRRNCQSGYKGVHWHKGAKKYRAQIFINGKAVHLGFFTEAVEAARAYDTAAREQRGSFAVLNLEVGVAA